MIRRGQIHWVVTDKRRPAVILSPDRRNQLASSIVVLPCSTRHRPLPWHVLLKRGEGGLPEASTVKCEEIATLPKERVDADPIGPALPPHRILEIERALLKALAIDPAAHV